MTDPFLKISVGAYFPVNALYIKSALTFMVSLISGLGLFTLILTICEKWTESTFCVGNEQILWEMDRELDNWNNYPLKKSFYSHPQYTIISIVFSLSISHKFKQIQMQTVDSVHFSHFGNISVSELYWRLPRLIQYVPKNTDLPCINRQWPCFIYWSKTSREKSSNI